jgi:hypothetical protein
MKRLIFICVAVFIAKTGLAQPGSSCNNAISMSTGIQYCETNDNSGSFDDASGTPTNPCNSLYNDGEYWFEYTGTGNALDLDVTGLTATYSGLYVLDDCPNNSPNCVASYSSGSSTADFTVSTPALTNGQTYYIVLANWASPYSTDFCLEATVTVPPTPPANDDCNNAISLTVNPDLNCGTVTSGTVELSTASPDPTNESCGGTADDDVWYSFVATQTTHQVSLLNTAGSTTDMYHSVYEAGPGCPGLGTEIVCSDPDVSNIAGLTIGNTYYVRVYTWTSTTGQTSTFDICIGTPSPPPTNVDCGNMEPICTNSGLNFTAQSGGADADVVDPGNDYGCLSSQPNPTWFYFEMSSAGNIDFDMAAGSDIDFALWGPYTNLAAAQADCGSMPAPIDCSFSTSATETANIAGAQVGEVYVLLITNYANVTQQITATQTGGNAATDCTIVTCPGADAGTW